MGKDAVLNATVRIVPILRVIRKENWPLTKLLREILSLSSLRLKFRRATIRRAATVKSQAVSKSTVSATKVVLYVPIFASVRAVKIAKIQCSRISALLKM
jgi:hypothetical protein